jgi:putative ABC transport system substrate-binding protein
MFIGAFAVGLVSAPLPTRGQPLPMKTYRIGFLGSESGSYERDRVEVVRNGLRELGYPEGSIVIETRLADGDYGRLAGLAAELVNLKVDVLVCSGTKAGLAAKRATATIPIVVSNMGDAQNSPFIASFARPGGNVTGMSLLNRENIGKQLELLKQIKPQMATVAILLNPANPNVSFQSARREVESLHVALESVEVHGANEIEGAISNIAVRRIDALLVTSETLFASHYHAIADRAVKARIASAGTFDFAHAGGLVGYSTSRMEAWRYLVGYVDKILKGAKPGDLPVEQPMKNELVINLKTAKALGLTVPQSLLLRADEVIQ